MSFSTKHIGVIVTYLLVKVHFMKMVFLVSFFFCFISLSIAQQIVSEKYIVKDDQKYKIVTTRKGVNPIQDMLTSGHQIQKIFLQDSVNKLDFNLKYYLEEYQNGNNIKTEDKALHSSFNSTYICELTINRMTNNMLSIVIQRPGFDEVIYIPPVENSRFKWKIFSKTPFNKNVPVFLVYRENPDEDFLENKIEKLFQSSAFVSLNDKDKIIERIKSTLDNFYMFFYDVMLRD